MQYDVKLDEMFRTMVRDEIRRFHQTPARYPQKGGKSGAPETIRGLKLRLNLNNRQLAKRVGVSGLSIYNWLKGKNPSKRNMEKLKAL